MNCRDAAESITALVDGELPPAERGELEAHLSACAPCREARAAEEAVAARLRAAPRPPLPAGFSSSVMAKVAAERPRGRVLPLWPLLAAASAVAAAVVAMVVIGPGADRGGPVLTAAAPPAVNDAGGYLSKEAPRPAVPVALPAAGETSKPSGAKLEESKDDSSVAMGPGLPPTAPAPAELPAEPTMDPAPAAAAAPAKEAVEAEDAKEEKKRGANEAPADADEVLRDRADKAKGARDSRREEEREAASPTRIALQYRVPVLADAQQSVEGALLANRGLATRGGTWKAPMEGEVRQEQNRVLLLQVRPENLEKLRAALDRASGLAGSTVELLDRGGALPPEVSRLLAAAAPLGRMAGAPAPPAGPAPVPAPGYAAGTPAGGGGKSEEPDRGPPPKLTPEQLRKLADAPPPAKEGPTTAVVDAVEVLVEIHLETAVPEKR